MQDWINTRAVGWLNDVPRAVFQRRHVGLVEDGGALVAVAAWQDVVRVDVEGIWLEVLAVATASQHGGVGQQVYDLVVDGLRIDERDGDALVGLVHVDNDRSQRLLTRNGWRAIAPFDGGHELWVGEL